MKPLFERESDNDTLPRREAFYLLSEVAKA